MKNIEQKRVGFFWLTITMGLILLISTIIRYFNSGNLSVEYIATAIISLFLITIGVIVKLYSK